MGLHMYVFSYLLVTHTEVWRSYGGHLENCALETITECARDRRVGEKRYGLCPHETHLSVMGTDTGHMQKW